MDRLNSEKDFAPLKRVLAIHDISSVGKCSLTVALPVISAANVECSALPTAILSTHTGGFSGMEIVDFENHLIPFVKHWLREGITFDAIYTGYLASGAQADLVIEIIDMLAGSHPIKGEKPLIIVDPVMADKGKLYAHFDQQIIEGMKKMCARADVIVPNITEACFILRRAYIPAPITKAFSEEVIAELAKLGPSKIVLTDISLDKGHLGTACYDKESGETHFIMRDIIAGSYHGTGDVFASALTGSLLRGKNLYEATEIAVDFTCASISHSAREKTLTHMGVRFEAELGNFAAKLV